MAAEWPSISQADIRYCGRIGTRSRSMVMTYQNDDQAVQALDELESQKRGRGYIDASS